MAHVGSSASKIVFVWLDTWILRNPCRTVAGNDKFLLFQFRSILITTSKIQNVAGTKCSDAGQMVLVHHYCKSGSMFARICSVYFQHVLTGCNLRRHMSVVVLIPACVSTSNVVFTENIRGIWASDTHHALLCHS